MQSPKNLSASPKILEKTKFLDLILTLTFFLFVLACNFSISITQIAGFTGLAILLIRTQLTRSWNKLDRIFLWPFLGLFLAVALSTALSINPSYSLPIFKKLALFAILFWVVNGIQHINLRQFQPFLARFLKSIKQSSSIASYFNRPGSISPIPLIIFVLIAATTASALYGLIQALNHGISLENRTFIHGTLSHVFTFSAILMMINLISLAYLLFGTQNKPWLWISFLIISICLVFTFTRMAWLGFFVGLIFLLFFKKKIFVFLPPILLVFILFFSPDAISDRFISIVNPEGATAQLRLKMWKSGLDVIKDYPLTGCGYNCLYLIHDQYQQHPILQTYFYNLHNNLVQIAVDLGLVGLGAWLSLWVCYFAFLFRRYLKSSPASPGRWVMLGSGAAVISFLTAGVFETNFYDSEVVMVLYFIMALPFVYSNNAKSDPSDPTSSSLPR